MKSGMTKEKLFAIYHIFLDFLESHNYIIGLKCMWLELVL